MEKALLEEILRKHSLWIIGDKCGEQADLWGDDLRGEDLRKANLWRAILREANLWGASLWGANLCGADLRGANLQGADLRRTDLWRADLREANLREAQMNYPIRCSDTGAFVAWKSAGECIVKLLIPEDAQRSSATTNKCRCSKAEVLEIQNLDGTDSGRMSVLNERGGVYTIGATTFADSWDENRWNECSHGIHFFLTREEAVEWAQL